MASLSETAVRRLRSTIFDYDGTPKEAQADRVFEYLLQRVRRQRSQERRSEPTGPYSGLTRGDLRKTGTCEADWF